MSEDGCTERLIKERIDQAIQRELPQLLINFYYYNNVDVWPIWKQSHPEDVPVIVESVKDIENSLDRKITEVRLNDKLLVFKKFKVGQDPIEIYEHEYWMYEIVSEGRPVLGVEVKNHWAGGKPKLKEVTAYIPGAWEQWFKDLKAECDVLTKQRAETGTAEKRQKKQQHLKERLARFGLDDTDSK